MEVAVCILHSVTRGSILRVVTVRPCNCPVRPSCTLIVAQYRSHQLTCYCWNGAEQADKKESTEHVARTEGAKVLHTIITTTTTECGMRCLAVPR